MKNERRKKDMDGEERNEGKGKVEGMSKCEERVESGRGIEGKEKKEEERDREVKERQWKEKRKQGNKGRMEQHLLGQCKA